LIRRNYFDKSLTKVFLDLYLAKFSDNLAKPFFSYIYKYNVFSQNEAYIKEIYLQYFIFLQGVCLKSIPTTLAKFFASTNRIEISL